MKSEGIISLRQKLREVDELVEEVRSARVQYEMHKVAILNWRHVYLANPGKAIVARVEQDFPQGLPDENKDPYEYSALRFLLDSFPQMKVTEYKNAAKDGKQKMRLVFQGKDAAEFCRFRRDMILFLPEDFGTPINSDYAKPLNSIITDIDFYFNWLDLPKLPRGRGKRTPEMIQEVEVARENFLYNIDMFYGKKRA